MRSRFRESCEATITCSVDTYKLILYNSASMKKLIYFFGVIFFLALPFGAKAQETVCTQYYGGGVVCGVHTPVNTGIVDNIPLIASGFLGAGAVLAYLSRKRKRV